MGPWIERQRYLIDYTLSSLARRKTQNAGLVLVYALIVFALASVMLFSQAVRREAALLLAGAPEVIVQRLVAGRHDLIPAEYVAKLAAIRGVQSASGRLWGYFFDAPVQANYTLMVPAADAPAPGSIAIGAAIARTRGAEPGDTLSLRGHDGTLFPLRVARVIESESQLVSADLVLVSEQDFRRFFGIAPGRYTDIVLAVHNPTEVRKVAQKAVQLLPDTRPILREEILRTYESIFHWREGLMLLLLAGAALAFVIFAWNKASGLSAEEKREIGILKAIGWQTGDVLKMKAWEGALVSISAFLLGYLAAYLHVFRFASALFEPVLKGWAVLYPRFELTPVIDGYQVATLAFLTIFPYAVATVIPIWRAAITDPDAVMR